MEQNAKQQNPSDFIKHQRHYSLPWPPESRFWGQKHSSFLEERLASIRNGFFPSLHNVVSSPGVWNHFYTGL